jgi:chromosome segregation ATPase
MKLDDDIMARLAQVASPVFLTELLMHSLTHAKETFSLQKVKIISLNSQNSHLSTSLSAVEEEVRRLHATVQRKENSIQKWRICYERSQSRVRALDKTLQRYRSPTSESQRQGMALDIPTLGL